MCHILSEEKSHCDTWFGVIQFHICKGIHNSVHIADKNNQVNILKQYQLMHSATYKLEHLHLHLHLHLQESCIDKHAMEIRDLAVRIFVK